MKKSQRRNDPNQPNCPFQDHGHLHPSHRSPKHGTARPWHGTASVGATPRTQGVCRALPHKLQPATCKHSSSRGVDEFGGFKLVLGTWRKKRKQNNSRNVAGHRTAAPAPSASSQGHSVHHPGQTWGPWGGGGGGGGRCPCSAPCSGMGKAIAASHPHPPSSTVTHAARLSKQAAKHLGITSWVTGVGIPLLQSGGAGGDVGSTGTYCIRASGRPGHSSLPAPFRGHRGKKLPHHQYRRAPRLPRWRTSFTASKIRVHYLCLT